MVIGDQGVHLRQGDGAVADHCLLPGRELLVELDDQVAQAFAIEDAATQHLIDEGLQRFDAAIAAMLAA